MILQTIFVLKTEILHFLSLKPAVYTTDNFCTKNGNSSFLKPKIRSLYTRAVTDQEQVIMARLR